MLHSNSHRLFVFVLVIMVSVVWTWTPMVIPNSVDDKDCQTIEPISHVCYQCAKRHPGNFKLIYEPCCDNRVHPDVREYCYAIYTEPPKRGGLWD